MSECTRISISVRSSPPRALYFCVRLYSANPQGLHTVRWCSPPKALYLCVLQYGASPNGLCTVRAYSSFCVLYEPQELCAVRAYKVVVLLCTVRAPRALCGASLQRLFASVYCTSPKSFMRCEPTKALCGASLQRALCFCVLYEPQELCAVRAYKGFCASVYCTSPTSFVRCEPTKAL